MSGSLVIPPLTLVNGALQVSPTQLDDMRRCFEYWGYKHVHRREPNTAAPERDCGKAGHAGLQAYGEARLAGATEADARAAMHDAVVAAFRSITVPDDEAWRTPVRYNEALVGYLDHYGQDPFEVLGVEVAFSVPLGEVQVPGDMGARIAGNEVDGFSVVQDVRTVPVVLRGIIDRVIRWDGIVRVGDYKFKSDWGDAAQAQYSRDPQFKLYAWALRELQASGTRPDLGAPSDVTGSVIDAIVLRKPLTGTRESKVPRTEYRRVHYPYTLAQLEESRQHALSWVRMALQQHSEGAFVQNESKCSFFFGKRCCPYLDICSVPVDQRQLVLSSDYYRDKVEYMAAKEVDDAIE